MAKSARKDLPRAIEFITLTSGGTTVSARSEVEGDVIQRIQHALVQEAGRLWGGWVVTQIQGPVGGFVYDMSVDGIHMSRCWLCTEDAASDVMWETCEGSAPPTVVLHRPRGVPWLAIALQPSAILAFAKGDPQKLLELADAERCVAWALITGP
jgi:hypothetical protein